MASFAGIGLVNQERAKWKARAEKAEASVLTLTQTNSKLTSNLQNCSTERASFRELVSQAEVSRVRAEAERDRLRAGAAANRKRNEEFTASLQAELKKIRPAAEQCDAAAAVVQDYRRIHQQR